MISDNGYAIETDGLTKVFKQRWSKREVKAVDSISLRVRRGATYGLLGRNGAGKTTFVKMLLACSHPSAGRALIFGRDSWIPESRRSIGYLPENHRFPTYMTGADMLEFYGALSGLESAERARRIPELLDLVGLDRWGGTRIGKYSKGMLQRVGLAQALMHNPQLLILDEPSDGVDPVGRKQIRDILNGMAERGVTVFLNSHLLEEVQLFCQDVAIIDKGKVALEGNVQELTAGSGYRITTGPITDNLQTEVRSRAKVVGNHDGEAYFLFASREDANQAVDVLRSQQVEIESFARSSSTLEEIFIKTVEAK